MSDDAVATKLASIRERSDRPLGTGALPISNPAVQGLMESAGDVPRLLAATEAVLELHSPIPGDPEWCRECGHSFPCWTRRKIGNALTGEEPADG